MRPLDLHRLCISLLPRVLAILSPKNLANCLLLVLGRTVGSLRDSSPEGLRSSLDLVHTKITQHREIIDFTLSRGMSPPAHYYRDLDVLHAEYDHLCRALVESCEASASRRRGDSPDFASPDVASPAAAPRPPLHVQILHHAQGFAIHLSLGLLLAGINDLLHKTVLVHETLQAIVPITVASPKIAHVSDSPLAIILATDGDSLQGIPLLLSVGDSLQRIPFLLRVGVHPVPRLMMPPLREPRHGLLLPVPLLLSEKIETLMIPPSRPPFGRWWTTFSRLFPSLRLLLPIRRRGPSTCLPLRA